MTGEIPKLSETGRFKSSRLRCQQCGDERDPDRGIFVDRWQEYDDDDRPTFVIVPLCRPCSKEIVEPHPRLYRVLDRFEPAPGSMRLCDRCRFREHTACTHPDAKANGGNGVAVTGPEPTDAHLNFGGGKGGWHKIYPSEQVACKQREESTPEPVDAS